MPPIEIPNRSLFKAPEVCQMAGVPPYVLRTWEAEFPDLGVSKTLGGPRVYRRSDVERVLQIKELLFVEGLTLAGVRRRLGEQPRVHDPGEPELDELLGRDARERVLQVRQGLRDVLQLLSRHVNGGGVDASFELQPSPSARTRRAGAAGGGSVKKSAGKSGKMARRAKH